MQGQVCLTLDFTLMTFVINEDTATEDTLIADGFISNHKYEQERKTTIPRCQPYAHTDLKLQYCKIFKS